MNHLTRRTFVGSVAGFGAAATLPAELAAIVSPATPCSSYRSSHPYTVSGSRRTSSPPFSASRVWISRAVTSTVHSTVPPPPLPEPLHWSISVTGVVDDDVVLDLYRPQPRTSLAEEEQAGKQR